ncbi:MAG: Glycosyl hydrolase family 109 protein 1 precursor [Lentisphaerae bacterium ADurb.Bin242]|nr:MAG: Glycosyl hydrolase family 109 protein 1 precursor [Lentisphaerae bacterium ADurb.Bin242]
MNKKVKTAVLGCGPRGIQMARIVKLVPECCRLIAMSDPNPDALAGAKKAFPEIGFFQSSDELLDSGMADAVITEIPPAAHTEYVIKALERGIHVLGEIPAVNSIEEGELLWKKVNDSKALYMCGANPNYRAKTAFLLKMREMGLLGNIAYIETEYMHDMRGMTDQWRRTYESCRYCTHSLGPVLELLKDDEFVSVSCMGTGDHFHCGCSHNAMSALLRTKNDVVVRFLTAFAIPYHGPAHTARIFAEKGIVELRNEGARLWLTELNEFSARNDFLEIPFTPAGADRPNGLKILDEELFRQASCGHNGSDIFMLRDFADAVLNGKPSPVGIREGLAMTLPGIYAALSAREGGALKPIRYPWS